MDVLFSAALAAHRSGDLAEAERLYRLATAGPNPANAHHNLGAVLKERGELAAAESAFRSAVDAAPNNPLHRHSLALVLMTQGRYGEAGPFYEARHDVRALETPKARFPFPEWNGEPVADKTFVVFPEQGLGDQIQYARFAPVLQRQGARVVMFASPPLVGLFRSSFPEVIILPTAGKPDFPDPDYWAMSGALTARLAPSPDRLPVGPYLSAAARTLGGIGLVTSGNPHHLNDAHRSLTKDAANRLWSALPNAISLRPEDTGARDFMETAQIIAGLSVVVTVDTSVAHLAGALGVTTIILLPCTGTDWRWMTGRSDSPWYPSAHLVRQRRPGEWEGPIEAVAELVRGMHQANSCAAL